MEIIGFFFLIMMAILSLCASGFFWVMSGLSPTDDLRYGALLTLASGVSLIAIAVMNSPFKVVML